MGLVPFADGDDLTVARLEPETELAGLVLVDLELARSTGVGLSLLWSARTAHEVAIVAPHM